VYPMYKAFIEPDLKTAHINIVNKLNPFTGFQRVLPVSIGNLSDQLTFLSLGVNQLSGSLPSSIGSLVGLTRLVLGANRFKGKIPTTIGKLQKLQVLYLDSNNFSGPIPDVIGNLSLQQAQW
ncbi:kinase-like domain-containing protein, partial [Tanacetum coccineum]